MNTELYLDTARLGRMCRTARRAELDFTKLVSQSGSSLYLERFLSEGFHSLSARQQSRLRGLRFWHGIDGFQNSIGLALGAPRRFSSQIFSLSKSLISFSAEFICRTSKRILVTDLEWPSYIETLRTVAKQNSVSVQCCQLQSLISDGGSVEDVLRALVDALRSNGCDAAFLSDISYQGVRLPLERFRQSISDDCFFVVDGSQTIGHRPVNVQALDCDLYLTGVQKWLGGFHPLRIAFLKGPGLHRIALPRIEDPLNQFCNSLSSQDFHPLGETVSILPLVTAAAAFHEHIHMEGEHFETCWKARRRNAKQLIDFLGTEEWIPFGKDGLHSGIVFLRPKRPVANAPQLRRSLAEYGIVASTYADGSTRMAMPSFPLSFQQLTRVFRGLNMAPKYSTKNYSNATAPWRNEKERELDTLTTK